MKTKFCLIGAFAALGLAGSAAALAAVAGSVVMAKGAVTATDAANETRFLGRGSEVNTGDRVVTADKSFAVISFADGTKTTLRPGSELVIEKYSHGEADKQDEAVFDLVRGGLRAVSGIIGKENPDGFRVNTIAASMGIRGTAWDIRVCEDGTNSCIEDNNRVTAGKPAAAQNFAQSKCDNAIDLDGEILGDSTYYAVYEGKIIVYRDGQEFELAAGDAGVAGRQAFGCVKTIPAFLLGDETLFPDQVDAASRGFLELRCE